MKLLCFATLNLCTIVVEGDDFTLLSGGYIRLKKEGRLQYLRWQKEVGFVEVDCSEKQIPLGCLPLSEIGLTETDLKNN